MPQHLIVVLILRMSQQTHIQFQYLIKNTLDLTQEAPTEAPRMNIFQDIHSIFCKLDPFKTVKQIFSTKKQYRLRGFTGSTPRFSALPEQCLDQNCKVRLFPGQRRRSCTLQFRLPTFLEFLEELLNSKIASEQSNNCYVFVKHF